MVLFTNPVGAVADQGDGPQGPGPPALFLDQTEAGRAEKNFFETALPPSSSFLNVWIRLRGANRVT